MADMTLTISVRGTKAGNTFEWERTATIADIEHVAHQVNEYQATLNPVIGDATPGVSAHDYSGIGVGVIINRTAYGVTEVQLADNALNVLGQYVLGVNMPFVFYAGYDFNGGANATNTATDGPTVDVDSVYIYGTGGNRRFATLFGLKPIS